MDTTPAPRKRRASLEDNMAAPVYTDAPLPPFTFGMDPLVWITFTADPARLRPFVPDSLRTNPEGTAHLACFRAKNGWGIHHTSGIFPAFVVEDHPSPDTAEAAFIPTGLAEGAPAGLLARHYAPFEPGRCAFRREGDSIHVAAWQGEDLILEATVAVGPEPMDSMGAIDRYIGRDETGALVSSLVACTGPCRPVRVTGLRIAPAAPPVWQVLAEARVDWAINLPLMLTNWSVPTPLFAEGAGEAARASRQALLDMLDRQGVGAAVLRPDGLAVALNLRARVMLSQGGQGLDHPLRQADPSDRARLLDSLRRAAGQAGFVAEHFRLPRPAGQVPLILQVAALDPALAEGGAALVLIRDPAEVPDTVEATVLQLLGLTPAEARVAAAVGAGLPPREAALRLHLTEGTVRSTLKVVFDKLALSRQVDLVQLVARLSG